MFKKLMFLKKNNYSVVLEIIYKFLINSNLHKNTSYFIIQIFLKIKVRFLTYILHR